MSITANTRLPPELEMHTLVPSAAGASGSFRHKAFSERVAPCSANMGIWVKQEQDWEYYPC